MAVVISQLEAQIGERGRGEYIDAAQQMVRWDALIEVKLVEDGLDPISAAPSSPTSLATSADGITVRWRPQRRSSTQSARS